MAESSDYIQNRVETDAPRTAEEIRRSIASEKELISETVNKVGERLRETVDWRTYVKERPFISLGVATGIGFLVAGLFKPRTTPAERIAERIADAMSRVAATRQNSDKNAIALTLLGLATKAAGDWLKTKSLQPKISHGPGKSSPRAPIEKREPSSPNYAEDQLII